VAEKKIKPVSKDKHGVLTLTLKIPYYGTAKKVEEKLAASVAREVNLQFGTSATVTHKGTLIAPQER